MLWSRVTTGIDDSSVRLDLDPGFDATIHRIYEKIQSNFYSFVARRSEAIRDNDQNLLPDILANKIAVQEGLEELKTAMREQLTKYSKPLP
jgi:hypothetical protein